MNVYEYLFVGYYAFHSCGSPSSY